MKMRNGFVSNSSSSSFILVYENLWTYWKAGSETETPYENLKRIGKSFLDHEEFALIFECGNSGDCMPMLVIPNQEIKDFILEKKLFENKKFHESLEEVILLKKREVLDRAVYKFETVEQIRETLKLAEEFPETVCFDYGKSLDQSSIVNDYKGESLALFKRFMISSGILEED